MAKRPIKYNTINKFQPEHAQADIPNARLKTKQESIYFQKKKIYIKRKYTNPSKSTIQNNSKKNNDK